MIGGRRSAGVVPGPAVPSPQAYLTILCQYPVLWCTLLIHLDAITLRLVSFFSLSLLEGLFYSVFSGYEIFTYLSLISLFVITFPYGREIPVFLQSLQDSQYLKKNKRITLILSVPIFTATKLPHCLIPLP